MGFVVVMAIFVTLALLAGRYGADSRERDPRWVEQQWPFFRHRS